VWYLNSTKIVPDDLPSTLQSQIGTRTRCMVLFDAEPEVDYSHAIDIIEQTPGRVVLLTAQTKHVRIPKQLSVRKFPIARYQAQPAYSKGVMGCSFVCSNSSQ
jgi:hypothetical protein